MTAPYSVGIRFGFLGDCQLRDAEGRGKVAHCKGAVHQWSFIHSDRTGPYSMVCAAHHPFIRSHYMEQLLQDARRVNMTMVVQDVHP